MQQLSVVLFAAFVCTVLTSSPKAVGPCILDRCQRGFMCSDSECVPNPNEIEELGPCVNSLCPKTYLCNDDTCIRPIPKVRAGSEPIGPCVNNLCPDSHMCVTEDYKCYPME